MLSNLDELKVPGTIMGVPADFRIDNTGAVGLRGLSRSSLT